MCNWLPRFLSVQLVKEKNINIWMKTWLGKRLCQLYLLTIIRHIVQISTYLIHIHNLATAYVLVHCTPDLARYQWSIKCMLSTSEEKTLSVYRQFNVFFWVHYAKHNSGCAGRANLKVLSQKRFFPSPLAENAQIRHSFFLYFYSITAHFTKGDIIIGPYFNHIDI